MNLLLDTDIGSDVDDALALALIVGSPELTLDGVTTVYGDTALRARLVRRYLRLAGADSDITIAAGAVEARSGRKVWWTGHEGALFDDLESERVDTDAVSFLVNAVAAAPGEIDVLAIGPLTNIADALDADPSFAKNVRRLVIMGADFRTDRVAEHNIKCDVDAARRVFSSGIDIYVGGLDLTLKILIDAADVAQIADAGPFGDVLAREIDVWWKFNNEDGNNPHDPILALYIAKPELFTTTRTTVEFDDEGTATETDDPDGNVYIIDTLSPAAVKAELVKRIVNASFANQNA
ncbi:nucleoside hydrolase [Microbacterium maritypicum]